MKAFYPFFFCYVLHCGRVLCEYIVAVRDARRLRSCDGDFLTSACGDFTQQDTNIKVT